MTRDFLDVGNQLPVNFTPTGAAKAREDWLTTCWGCHTKGAVPRDSSLGLCPDCVEDLRYPGYEEAA